MEPMPTSEDAQYKLSRSQQNDQTALYEMDGKRAEEDKANVPTIYSYERLPGGRVAIRRCLHMDQTTSTSAL